MIMAAVKKYFLKSFLQTQKRGIPPIQYCFVSLEVSDLPLVDSLSGTPCISSHGLSPVHRDEHDCSLIIESEHYILLIGIIIISE